MPRGSRRPFLNAPTIAKDRFLRACRNEPTDRVPVWFMRQAGRSLPEYRRLKEGRSMLELCRTPELAVEATLQPVRRLGVDAAILFSDIVVPLAPVLGDGTEVSVEPGVGPVFSSPLRSASAVRQLRSLEPEADVPFVVESVEELRRKLDVPLIGFAGAPFTLACYLIEGRPSKDYALARAFMRSEPRVWHDLMTRIVGIVVPYLRAQIEAGVSAVQLFDSWIGLLSRSDFDEYARPALARIVAGLGDTEVPLIYFGLGSAHLLPSLADMGWDVFGIDWRTPLHEARSQLPKGAAVQGNLDPAACLAPWPVVEHEALEILERGGGRAHVFNLGHGVLPTTDPVTLERIVELVHGWDPSGR